MGVSKETPQTYQYSPELIPSVVERAAGKPPKVNLHIHGEGTLGHQGIFAIAEELGVSLDNIANEKATTKDIIQTTMQVQEGEEMSLDNFIKKLSTKWLQLILIKKLLAEPNIDPAEILETFFSHILNKWYQSGLRVVDGLFSPLALTGNLTRIAQQLQKEGHLTQNEYENVANLPEKTWKDLNLETYFQALNKVIDTNDKFSRLSPTPKDQKLDSQIMYINIRFCIRREKDGQFANQSWIINPKDNLKPHQDVNKALELCDQGLFDGFDLAGVEELKKVQEFTWFFYELRRLGIPFTIHAGELVQEKANLAYENIFWAIILGAQRIAHATRLPDNHPLAKLLMAMAIQSHVVIDGNLTSNLYTEVVDELANHPWIEWLKNRLANPQATTHNLLGQEQRLTNLPLTFNDDDPALFDEDQSYGSLTNEWIKLCQQLFPHIIPQYFIYRLNQRTQTIARDFVRIEKSIRPTISRQDYLLIDHTFKQLYQLLCNRAFYNLRYQKPDKPIDKMLEFKTLLRDIKPHKSLPNEISPQLYLMLITSLLTYPK